VTMKKEKDGLDFEVKKSTRSKAATATTVMDKKPEAKKKKIAVTV
jgi:hypothetical protein